MGQTDAQFKAFIRVLFGRIETAEKFLEESEIEKAKAELRSILNDFQKSLED